MLRRVSSSIPTTCCSFWFILLRFFLPINKNKKTAAHQLLVLRGAPALQAPLAPPAGPSPLFLLAVPTWPYHPPQALMAQGLPQACRSSGQGEKESVVLLHTLNQDPKNSCFTSQRQMPTFRLWPSSSSGAWVDKLESW